MSDIIAPTIHSNGTSEQELMRNIEQAVDFLGAARDAVAQTAPHGRDYYVQSDKAAFVTASRQHATRMQKLNEVIDELSGIGHSIYTRDQS